MKKIILLISFLFLSINGYSQFPEGFEGFPAPTTSTWTLGSGDWAVFDNGVQSAPPTYWTTNPAIFPARTGSVAAYMDSKNIGAGLTSQDFLASPLLTIPANAQLKFWTRTTINGNDNTTYRVMFASPDIGGTQNDPASFITLQQFDETQLVTSPNGTVNNYDVWTEHIIDLPFEGQQIYIAFVMENTQSGASASGDRFLLDDINIVSQCFDPTTLPTTNLTATTATLNWSGTSSAYDVEVLLASANQGSGTFTNGVTATTLPVTGLLANTCYKYYVRSVCSVGNTSGWAGPFNFCTTIAPVGCGGNYADPGGAAGNYSNNANVPTLICAPAGQIVTVTFTSFATEGGFDFLKVYDGNSATGTTQLGNFNGTLTGANLPVVTSSGNCLYFVFTSDGSQTGAGWIANITCTPAPTCVKPNTLVTSAVLATSATLTWQQPQNPGGSTANQWQAIAVPCSPTIPAANDPVWSTNPILTSPTFNFVGLLPSTCYDFYVRAICSPTETSDPSVKVTATTTAVPPACGGQFLDSGGPSASYGINENITTTICAPAGQLVTVTFTAFNTENNFDRLRVFEGPNNSGTLLGNFTGDLTANLPVVTSSGNCLTFVFTSDGSVNSAGWVANVTCAPAPTCSKPTNLITSNVLSGSVALAWQQPVNPDNTTASAWEVIAVPCSTTAPAANNPLWTNTLSTTPSYTVTGLTPNTCYDFYVRAVCSTTDSSTPSVKVSATTQVAPPVCGGNFVDPGGAGANYANNANSTVTICPPSGQSLSVVFTMFNTENNFDRLRVFDGTDTSATGTLLGNYTGVLTGANLPTVEPLIPGGCLTFVFTSDGSVNAAGWMANVVCIPLPTCTKPSSLTATLTTQTSAQLGWTQLPNPNGTVPTAWEIFIVPLGGAAPTPTTSGILTTNNPYPANGLAIGQAYTFYVRAVCSSTDTSQWSAPFTFSTLPANDECANAIFAVVNQNLNCVQVTPGTISGATGSLPATTCAGTPNDDVWFTFTATADTHIISFPGTANNVLNYAIFQGTCGNLTQVGCNTGANLTPGTTYFIRVYSIAATPQFIDFNLCIGTLPCSEAPAFCTGQTVTYANATNVPGIGQVGCLSTTPNPAFFFLQVNNAGPLSYNITQQTTAGVGIDVDYVAWGPFTDLNTACSGVPANPMTGILPAPNTTAGCPGTLHACSYSFQPNEVLCIPNAQLCEVYVVMITNFANQAGNVTFTQTNSGGGTTSCFPLNTFNYSKTSYCQNETPNPVFPILAPGASNGVYTAVPSTLVIDSATGAVDLAASPPGTYIITATTATTVGGTCNTIPSITTSRTLIITAPASATISYTAAAFCKNLSTQQPVTITGTIGGSFSTTPTTGLYIDSVTGSIVPSASLPGTYTVNYNVAATGGCPIYTTSTTVTIYDLPTITGSLSVCINGTTQLTGSATPASSNAWTSSNTSIATIDNSGLVTAVSAGTTTITYTNDLGCYNTAVVTVYPNATMSLSTSNNTQTVCINTAIANIDYATSLDVTSVTATGLPTGVTGVLTSGIYTISGTPSVSGTFPYSITTVGGCGSVTLTGTITVSPDVTMSLSTSNNTQTVCINTAIANIDYATSLNVTNVTATGLPTGVTGVLASGVYTISGTPSVSGTFPYSITTVGGCGSVTLTGTITISANPDFSLSGECQGSVYVIVANTDNLPSNASFHWTDSSNNTIGGNTSSIEISNPGTYECEVTIPNGTSSCSYSRFHTAIETACQIQRGISPNNDGDNEFFDLSSFDVKELSIYNRYGTKVYSKTDYRKEWTGKDLNDNDLPDGTYYYMFERRNSETKAGWIYINREKK